MGFGIGIERLPRLLGPAEVAAQREVLPQRITLGVGLPHQDAAQVGMPDEEHAEHVEDFALQPIGPAPEIPDRAHLERLAAVNATLMRRSARRSSERSWYTTSSGRSGSR